MSYSVVCCHRFPVQVSTQPAMECIPLVMEPESALYTDPVVVLDFQSLYPSLVIAYNLCFSTCLGRLSSANPKKLGVSQYHNPIGVFSQLKDDLLLLPNGVMYVPPAVRKGVLPRLLNEILTTRVMVKQVRGGPPAGAQRKQHSRTLRRVKATGAPSSFPWCTSSSVSLLCPQFLF